MDFGKFIYEKAKKEREAKRAQTKIEVKEIRLRPKTNEAHRGFKVDDARRWLLQGNKVRVTIKFRGREMDYPEIALEDLKEIAAALADVSVVEQAPQMEGRTMLVVLAPSKAYQALADRLAPSGHDITLPAVEIYRPSGTPMRVGELTVELAAP